MGTKSLVYSYLPCDQCALRKRREIYLPKESFAATQMGSKEQLRRLAELAIDDACTRPARCQSESLLFIVEKRTCIEKVKTPHGYGGVAAASCPKKNTSHLEARSTLMFQVNRQKLYHFFILNFICSTL